jgi:hypothetical protein
MIKSYIRVATESDWPAIEAWRAGHFLEMAARMKVPRPVTGQRTLTDAQWLVLEKDGRAVAATSFTVEGDVCVAHDLYAASGHVLDALALGRALEGMCDREGWELRARTDPENTAYVNILAKRGFVPVAIEFLRSPKGAVSYG